MRAVVFDRYGPPEVLRLGELARPRPRGDQVLVRTTAAAVNPKDCLIRRGKYRWLTGRRFPKQLGNDVSGEIVEVGPACRELGPGDRVYGMSNRLLGRCYAEAVLLRAREIALAPAAISLEHAAALPLVGQTALQALRDLGDVAPGDRVCILGASGGVGTVAVQLAKVFGAEVTAVSSKRNAALCRSLGADHVVPYDERDCLRPGEGFDLVFDVFGSRSFREARPALSARGCYINTIPSWKNYRSVLCTTRRAQRAKVVLVRSRRADLDALAALVDDGRLLPRIDRVLPLDEAASAHRFLETKRARGKVLLTPSRAALDLERQASPG